RRPRPAKRRARSTWPARRCSARTSPSAPTRTPLPQPSISDRLIASKGEVMSRKLAVPLALAAALAMHDASAFPTQQFQAKAVVAGNCTVTESGILDFGNYDPLTANATVAQPGSGASLSLFCTRGSHPHIAMDNGTNGARLLF